MLNKYCWLQKEPQLSKLKFQNKDVLKITHFPFFFSLPKVFYFSLLIICS